MKTLQLILISAGLCCAFTKGSAQSGIVAGSFGYYADALRYSQINYGGSARIQGLAGAQHALGGDISSVSSNPAGLGYFNRSEFSFSPRLSFGNSRATFIGEESDDFFTRFGFANAGLVFSFAKDNIVPGKWRGGSFGISYNSTGSFNEKVSFSGVNDKNSYIDAIVEGANGIPVGTIYDEVDENDLPYSFESLAYYTYLLNNLNNSDDTYFNLIKGDVVRQEQVITGRGGSSQMSFSYGGNYDDKLYFGMSLGLPSFRHNYEKVYTETVIQDNDTLPILNYYTINDKLSVNGSGINLTVGVNVRPVDWVRLGVTVATPTFYHYIRETSNTNILADYDPQTFKDVFDTTYQGPFGLSMVENEFAYRLRTPMKLTGGLAFFIKKYGFITFDADLVSYNRMMVQPVNDLYSFRLDNRTIRNIYRSTYNLRAGAEFRYDIFRLRGGYAFYGDPHDNVDELDRSQVVVSGGAGVKVKDFYLDLAVVNTRFRSGYSPYTLGDGSNPSALIKNASTNAVITTGFYF